MVGTEKKKSSRKLDGQPGMETLMHQIEGEFDNREKSKSKKKKKTKRKEEVNNKFSKTGNISLEVL